MGVLQKILSVLHIITRVKQCVIAVAVLGLSAYVANWYNSETLTASPGSVNFLVFVPLWSIISVLYLELSPKFAPRIANPYISILVEATNVLFYFSGSVALTVFLNRLLFCRGNVCTAAKVDVILAWVMTVSWVFTMLSLVLSVLKVGFRKPSNAPLRKPEMSPA